MGKRQRRDRRPPQAAASGMTVEPRSRCPTPCGPQDLRTSAGSRGLGQAQWVGYPCQRREPYEQCVSIEWQRTGCTARPLDPYQDTGTRVRAYSRSGPRKSELSAGKISCRCSRRGPSEKCFTLLLAHFLARRKIEMTVSGRADLSPFHAQFVTFAHRLSAGPDFRVSCRPLSPFILCHVY